MTELWSTDDAARHFGVSASRARAILATAGVHRISGYDADAVRNIHRPGQGARTDLKGTAMPDAVSIDLTDITSVSTGSFNPLHNVGDLDKVAALMASMREDGWKGAPIVSEGGENAWTGAHRITAATRLWNDEGISVEIPHVDIAELCERYDLDWARVMVEFDNDTYEAAAALRGRLPREVVEYLGFDVDGQ